MPFSGFPFGHFGTKTPRWNFHTTELQLAFSGHILSLIHLVEYCHKKLEDTKNMYGSVYKIYLPARWPHHHQCDIKKLLYIENFDLYCM